MNIELRTIKQYLIRTRLSLGASVLDQAIEVMHLKGCPTITEIAAIIMLLQGIHHYSNEGICYSTI